MNSDVALLDEVVTQGDLAGASDREAAVETERGVGVLTVPPRAAVDEILVTVGIRVVYGDACPCLVDVVVLDPGHGLEADSHGLAGEGLHLAHLDALEVTAGDGDVTAGTAHHGLSQLGLAKVTVEDGDLGSVHGSHGGPAAVDEVRGGEAATAPAEGGRAVGLAVVKYTEPAEREDVITSSDQHSPPHLIETRGGG